MAHGGGLAELFERIGALDARMDSLERQVEKIDVNLERLAAAANMGRGALWAATKIGAVLLIVIAAFAWALDRLRPLLNRWEG